MENAGWEGYIKMSRMRLCLQILAMARGCYYHARQSLPADVSRRPINGPEIRFWYLVTAEEEQVQGLVGRIDIHMQVPRVEYQK